MKDNQTLGILGSGVRDGLQLKPVRYEWAYRLYNQAVANTWFPNEVQLVQDLADFKKLTEDEKNALKTVISLLISRWLLEFILVLMRQNVICIYLSKCGKKLITL